MKDGQSSLSRETGLWWLLGLISACAVVAFAPLLTGATIVDAPYKMDIGNQWIPFSTFIKQCYLDFNFPLWDPHDLCGMPFLAFPHTESLYLPWVLEHLLAPSFHLATSINVFFHLCLAGCSVFALLSWNGRKNVSAFCGAVGFVFSGFFFAYINFPPSLASCAWLALWYAVFFRLLERPGFMLFVLSLFAFSGMIMGGDLETAVYGVLGACFEVGLRLRERSLQRRQLILAASAIAAGALLAFPQLFPAQELLSHSIRAESMGAAGGLLGIFFLPLKAVFQIPQSASIYPPNHGLDPFYLGPFLVLLAAMGLGFSYSRRRLLIFPLAAVYMIVMYAPPFSGLTSHIPILGQMVLSFRAWPIISLFFYMAAAYAMDMWIKGEAEKKGHILLPLGKGGAVFLLVCGLVTLVSLYWIRHAAWLRFPFVAALVAVGVAGIFPGVPRLARLLGKPRVLAAVLVAADVYLLALGWMPKTDPEVFKIGPRLASLLSNTAGQTRYHIISSYGRMDNKLLFHLGLRLDADNIATYIRVPARKDAKRLALLYPSLFKYKNDSLVRYDQMVIRDPAKMDRDRAELLNRMNVGILVGRHPVPALADLDLSPLLEDNSDKRGNLYAYRNKNAMPRAVLTDRKRSGYLRAVAVYPSPDSMKIQVPVERPPSFRNLSISDSYYPGWRAWQGDTELKIGSDRLNLRNVEAGASDRPVTMKYVPLSFRTGLWAGIAFGGGVLFFLGFYLWSVRKRVPGEEV